MTVRDECGMEESQAEKDKVIQASIQLPSVAPVSPGNWLVSAGRRIWYGVEGRI